MRGDSEDHTWRLIFILITINPCGWSTVGLLHIPVSVEAESPVAVIQPLRYLVLGCFLQLVTRFLQGEQGSHPSYPVQVIEDPSEAQLWGKESSF